MACRDGRFVGGSGLSGFVVRLRIAAVRASLLDTATPQLFFGKFSRRRLPQEDFRNPAIHNERTYSEGRMVR